MALFHRIHTDQAIEKVSARSHALALRSGAGTELRAQPATGQDPVVLVCQGCKFGCVLNVVPDGSGGLASVEGNTCEQGYLYAQDMARRGFDKTIGTSGGDGSQSGSSKGDTSAESTNKPLGYRAFRKRHQQQRQRTQS